MSLRGAKHRHSGFRRGGVHWKGRFLLRHLDGPFFKGRGCWSSAGRRLGLRRGGCTTPSFPTKIVMIHRRIASGTEGSRGECALEPEHQVLFNTVATKISGSKKLEPVTLQDVATGKTRVEAFDVVFVFVGSDPNTALVPEVAKDEANSIIADERMATSVPGLFVAGDVRVSPFRQIITACSDGAIAAHAASQYIDEARGAAYR